jgi:hypothetical protein
MPHQQRHPAQLSGILQPLLKAACSARGRRPHCDAAGLLLASAIEAVPLLLSVLREPLHTLAKQLCSLLLQGGMPNDNVGSFRALQACWSKLQCFGVHDARLTNMTALIILRTLRANRHWTVSIHMLRCVAQLHAPATLFRKVHSAGDRSGSARAQRMHARSTGTGERGSKWQH